MTKISVIVPVYNAEKYLEECLNSLKNQSFKDIEILCINDGSTDNSLDILNKFAQNDNRFKVFSQENAGPAKARNVGLANATGEFIMFCDADDTYEPKMCEKMYKTIKKHKTDLVMCNSNYFKKDLSVGKNSYLFSFKEGKKELTQDLIVKVNVYLWNKIFKASLIQNFGIDFPEGHKADDNLFVYKYLMSADTIYFLDQKLYNHFDRENSIMDLYYSNGIKINDLFDKSDIMAMLYDYLVERNLWEKNKKAFLNRFYTEYRFSWINVPEIWEKEFFENLKKNIRHIGIENIKFSNFLFHGIWEALENGNFYAASNLSDFILSTYKKRRNKYTFQENPKPIFTENTTALVFNCDNQFVKFFSVTLQSIIDHAVDTHYYDLVILNKDITNENKDKILQMIDGKENFSIRFFDMSEYERIYQISEYKTIGYVKTAAYYRLFIPKIFEHYQKVIYLDSDLIVNADIFELSTIDLKGYSCAAISDFFLSHIVKDDETILKGFYDYGKTVLHFENWKSYFNSGVMIYDIPKMIEKKYVEQFIDMAKINNRYFNDQNVLNSVLQNDVLLLDRKWNMQINNSQTHFIYLLPLNEMKIIHFCSSTKPWSSPDKLLGYMWWYYARKSPFYEIILKNNLTNSNSSGIIKNQKALVILMHPIRFKIKKMIYKIKKSLGNKYHREKYKKKHYDLKQLIKAAKELKNSVKF